MKQLFNISSDINFYITLGFLFLIPFTIAGCYLLFVWLLVPALIFWAKTLHPATRAKTPHPHLPDYYPIFLLFLLATFISTIFAIDFWLSFKDNKESFIYLLIPLFLLVINSYKRFLQSLFTVWASALCSALLGIAQSIHSGISLDHRLHGATSHWMTYAGLLMFPFIFFFIYLFYEKKIKLKLVLALSLLVLLVPILLSLTRSVWVGIFVALGIFLVYYRPKILYALLPLLICLLLILPGPVKSRLSSITDMSNDTNQARFRMARIALKIFKDYPLTGVGPNGIEKVYPRYKAPEDAEINTHLHNNFLHILAERGIIALFILLAAFFSLFRLLVKKIKSPNGPEEKIVAIAVLFLFIGFLVAGLFEYNFGDSEVKFLLFYFITLPFLSFLTAPSPGTTASSPTTEGVS